MLFLPLLRDRTSENVVETNGAVAVPLKRSCVAHEAQLGRSGPGFRAHAREVGAADSSSDSVRLSAEKKTCPLFNHGHALKTMPVLEVNGE